MPGTGISEVVLAYFIGTFGMLFLAASIFFFFVTYQKRILKKELEMNKIKAEQQEEILKNVVLAQERERKRIAGDLHDEVGAMLSVVKLNVGRMEKNVNPGKTKELAGETKLYINDVIMQVRRISRDLSPPSLDKFGLYYALEELATWINKSGELKILYHAGGEPYRFDSKTELAVFRIAQELLNNAIKHAHATSISINIRFCEKKTTIIITDNGKGFNKEETKQTGLGLKSMESRSRLIDAKFKLKSFPGKGTTAIVCVKTTKEI